MSTIDQNAKTVFREAVEKHKPESWPEFPDHICADDRELRSRVEALLHAHTEKDCLFDRAESTAQYRPTEQPGRLIGPLRERLGTGGMGVVWAAEQKQHCDAK